MATSEAISAVGHAVARLLDAAWKGSGRTGDISKVLASTDLENLAADRGVGLLLYQVRVNGPQRNRSCRTTVDGRRMRPSLPVDLHYLLIPLGKSVDEQHEILGWAMRTLEDCCILPAGLLNSAATRATNPAAFDTPTFLPSETVELVFDPLSLQDHSSLWQSFQKAWRPSVGYVAKMVALDSELVLADGPPVRVREFDYRGAERP